MTPGAAAPNAAPAGAATSDAAKRGIAFDNSYARDLDGLYVPVRGAEVPAPRIVRLNTALAGELGLPLAALTPDVLSGAEAPAGATPIAQVYAGHQFGGFSPQLGDGRALLLGEVVARERRYDIALKGSGRTPFARGGDGKAVLGPVLREYLVAEAMHALGVPTTRALAATRTGEDVMREGPKPGAVLARVASSHLRVGTFQFFSARGDHESLRRLLDYAVARHDPDLVDAPAKALDFLAAVVARQAALVAQWMSLGFVHGVMNTDNMTISGETIDYGPCAFLDAYDPATVFSSIDQTGRYAYGNQPHIAQWNLARLAEALLPLIDADTDAAVARAIPVIEGFMPTYEAAWTERFRAKLGLAGQDDADAALARDLLALMAAARADFTRTFRHLARDLRGDDLAAAAFADRAAFAGWRRRWMDRAPDPARMDAANPVYIPRNHRVEEALTAAESGDMAPFERLLAVLTTPFTVRDGHDADAQPAPEGFGRYTTFCGT